MSAYSILIFPSLVYIQNATFDSFQAPILIGHLATKTMFIPAYLKQGCTPYLMDFFLITETKKSWKFETLNPILFLNDRDLKLEGGWGWWVNPKHASRNEGYST